MKPPFPLEAAAKLVAEAKAEVVEWVVKPQLKAVDVEARLFRLVIIAEIAVVQTMAEAASCLFLRCNHDCIPRDKRR